MIQDVFDINMGYFSLLVNVPLLIIAFIMLNRDYAIKSFVYVVVFSVAVIFIKDTDISYFTQNGTSTVLAPITSGAIRGIIYAYTLRLNGSAGGVDIISSVIKIKCPHLDFMDNIFIINTVIAVFSFWVYGMNIEPVICSILYAYISSYTCNQLRSKKQENIKYEIITKTPNEIISYINDELHQTATIIDAKGAYSDENTNVVLCITKKNYAPHLEKFLLDFPNCITFKSYTQDSISGITYK
jgi:uncharacterized membrane-anchored protein YitT (DUF2179 family)